ncbi:prepilin-type N-terminal cleavage/methylation domain-containing protein [Pseudoteredinibacter isoporae]|uniref:prepilin-type N-terminal cleavage/methylation domain-containing protein n=1 Tax=Pseudoteredinibacter isoporae TaxID=570281 RepID=UPI00310A94A2
MPKRVHNAGFTLIELVAVIVILGILAAVSAPKFSDLSRAAKIAALEGIEETMRSTARMTKAMAAANGLKVSSSNPGGGQSQYVIQVGGGSSELDWRNLCPESRAELGSRLTMVDYINLTGNMQSRVNNRYTFIGFDIPGSAPSGQGCYVIYDSFGFPDCTFTVVDGEC